MKSIFLAASCTFIVFVYPKDMCVAKTTLHTATICIRIIIIYSCMCYFSKLEHIAHKKAKNKAQ